MKVTAETITDEQIREVRTQASLDDDDALHTYCSLALGISAQGRATEYQRTVARNFVAEAWNARHGAES